MLLLEPLCIKNGGYYTPGRRIPFVRRAKFRCCFETNLRGILYLYRAVAYLNTAFSAQAIPRDTCFEVAR